MSEQTIARLEELLSLKDEQLDAANARADDAERLLERGVAWMLHSRVKNDDLPSPRIEMRVIENSDFYVETSVDLLMPERGCSISRIPLGYSKRSGGGVPVELFPTHGEVADHLQMHLPGILNDACFYMEKTGLPAFVVLDEAHRYKVDMLRPLKLVAV